MKRLFILLLFLLGSSTIVSAREAWHDWCQIGNQHVITSGLSSTTVVQKSAPSCTVTIYVHGGGLATIYADNNGTVLANPFTSQSDGQIIWYADNGVYDQTTSSAGLPQVVTLSGILLCDPFEVGSTCNNGGTTTAHNLLSTTHLDTIPASPPVRGDLITAQNQTSPTGVNPSWARLPLGTLGQVVISNGTDAVWGTLTAGSNITITPSGSTLTIASTGGGSGCTLPGVTDTAVLSEHPVGTCYDSARFTWNDTNFNLQITSTFGANTVGTNNTFIIGPSNTLASNTFGYILGDQNSATTGSFQKEIFFLGSTNDTHNLELNNTATVSIGFGNEIGTVASSGSGGKNNTILGQNNAIYHSRVVDSLGSNAFGTTTGSGITQNGFAIGGNLIGNCINGGSGSCASGGSGNGGVNGFGVAGDDNLINASGNGTANSIYLFGFDNRADTTLGNITTGGAYEFGLDNEIDGSVGNDVVIGGASNTSHTSQVASCLGASDSTIWGNLNTVTGSSNFEIFGASNTVTSLNCVAIFGMKITATASNTAYFGMSTVPGLTITTASNHDNVIRVPLAFASLPACAAGTEGSFAAINDSTTTTIGATITGGSTGHVLGYCAGTNWKVAAN